MIAPDPTDPLTPIEPIPDWLEPTIDTLLTPEQREQRADLIAQSNKLSIAMQEKQFADMFEWIIEDIQNGGQLKASLNKVNRSRDHSRFMSWIMKNEDRKTRYYGALEIGAELIASEMLDIADAEDSLEDVARSTLRINTRKWLLGTMNRKRFGDTKQVEQTVTIDLSAAMEAAQHRVSQRMGNVIDVTPRVADE